MPWWGISTKTTLDEIKKRISSYFLRKYVGDLLKEKSFTLDQVSVDLYNGQAKFSNFEIDVSIINDKLSKYKVPFEIVDCFVGSAQICIPWTSILTDNPYLEIQDLEVTVRYVNKDNKRFTFMDSTSFDSVTDSMKLAEECLTSDGVDDKKALYYQGICDLALAIESFISKFRGILKDTTICFEYVHQRYTTYFELKIARIEYSEEMADATENAAEENCRPDKTFESKDGRKESRRPEFFRSKKLAFSGVRLYTGVNGELNRSNLPEEHETIDSFLIAALDGEQTVKINFEAEKEAKVWVDVNFTGGLHGILSPRILRYLHEIATDCTPDIQDGLSVDSFVFEKIPEVKVSGHDDKEGSPASKSANESSNNDSSEHSCFGGVPSVALSWRMPLISIVLLHEDDVREGRGWQDDLAELGRYYLGVVCDVPLSGVANPSDLVRLRKRFSEILNRDHFSLLLRQIELDLLVGESFVVRSDVGLVDVAESIVCCGDGKGIKYCPWLTLEGGLVQENEDGVACISRPSVKVKVEQKELTSNDLPFTRLLVVLTTTKCMSEIDVTVLERISALRRAFSPLPCCQEQIGMQSFRGGGYDVISVAVCFPLWICKMRIPKHDPTRSGRGRRLHYDFLWTEIKELCVAAEYFPLRPDYQEVDVSFMSINGCLKTVDGNHRLLTSTTDRGSSAAHEQSRVKMKFYSEKYLVGGGCDDATPSSSPVDSPRITDRVPFSRKRRQFENRELVEPGDRSEMMEYFMAGSSKCAVNVDVDLRRVALFVPRRNILRHLNERLLRDLKLFFATSTEDDIASSCVDFDLFAVDSKGSFDGDGQIKEKSISVGKQICIYMSVRQGSIIVDAQDLQRPGRFVLTLKGLVLTHLTGHGDGRPEQSVCLQANVVELSRLEFSDKMGSTRTGGDVTSTSKLLEMHDGNVGLGGKDVTREPLSLTFVVKEESDGLMRCKLAARVRDCTLHYVDAPIDKQWMVQLVEALTPGDREGRGATFLDEGPATPFDVECHLSLKNCRVEYKPSSLPYCVVASHKSIHVAARVEHERDGIELKVYIGDAGLFLAANRTPNPIDLKKYFVCIADVNAFDLSLNLLTKATQESPQTDLVASLNKLTVRTCSDSFVAASRIVVNVVDCLTSRPSSIDFDPNLTEPSRTGRQAKGLLLQDAIKSRFDPSRGNKIDHRASRARRTRLVAIPESRESLSSNPEEHLRSFDRDFCGKDDADSKIANVGCGGELISHVPTSRPFDVVRSLSSTCDGTCRSELACLHETESGRRSARCAHKGGEAVDGLSKPSQENATEKLKFVENHFTISNAQKKSALLVGKYRLVDTSLAWFLYGGNDFSRGVDSNNLTAKKGKSWQEFAGPGRRRDVLVEVKLNKIRLLHEEYPDGLHDVSRDVLFVREIEVLDRLEVSDIHKFLHLYSSESLPKQTNGNMVRASMRHVRSEESKDQIECNLEMSLQPIKLNIDQDCLMFLIDFFAEVNNPIDTTGFQSFDSPTTNLQSAPECPLLFSSIRFSLDVPIVIDYVGKSIRGEGMVGLLMGVTRLNQSQLVLRKVHCEKRLLGVDKVAGYMFNEWVEDIKNNQLSGLLRGIGPMNSLFQLASGLRDLFYLPIEQYRTDGRIIRGVQRGTYSFASNTSRSILEVTFKLFSSLQCLVDLAQYILSAYEAGGIAASEKLGKSVKKRDSMNIVKESLHKRKEKSSTGALQEVLRQLPPTVLEPIVVASKASVQNHLVPEMNIKEKQKWKAR